MSDHYALLGVRREASPQEIEAAYRRAALERGYQDGAWRELRDAYDVLRDPDQRAHYDETGDGALPKKPRKKTHNPLDRLFPNLPHGWRVAIDWVVTIVGAVAIVLAIKAWVVNPYRIPSSSMEPTLHCARPAAGCEAEHVRPCAREPVHLPLPPAEAGRDRRLHDPGARQAGVRIGGHVRQAADRASGRGLGGAERVRLHQRQEARRAIRPADRRDTRPSGWRTCRPAASTPASRRTTT